MERKRTIFDILEDLSGSKKRMEEELGKRYVEGKIQMALEGFKRMEFKIHQIGLSGDHSVEDLQGALGHFKGEPRRSGKYHRRAYLDYEDRPIIVDFNPREGCCPEFYFRFSNPSREFLSYLVQRLPDLKVSFLELAVDIFCGDWEYVDTLFWVLARALYVPCQRSATYYPGIWSEGIGELNSGLVIGNVIMYQRGPDFLKREYENGKEGWRVEDCDRIRLEFKAQRPHLRYHKVRLLSDFIENPRIAQMHRVKGQFLYQLKRAKDSSGVLPPWWDKDFNFFQQEVIKARDRGLRDVGRFMEDDERFQELYRRIVFTVRRYDRKWIGSFSQVKRI